jgi:hypothetical protein
MTDGADAGTGGAGGMRLGGDAASHFSSEALGEPAESAAT